MKALMARGLAGVLAVLLLLPNTAVSADGQTHETDVALAKEAGQSFLAIEAGLLHPEWKDAELVSPQTYEDLGGSTIAYMFAIVKGSEAVGCIMVGSSLYSHVVLEASRAVPPSVLAAEEVKASFQRQLGISVAQQQVSQPKRFVYLGYFAYYAVYDVDGQELALHLRTGYAAPISSLRSGLLEPSEWKTADTTGLDSYEYGHIDGVPTFTMYDHVGYVGPWTNNCGPTAAAMITQYYNQHGYPNFEDDWTIEHDALYDLMYTNRWGFDLDTDSHVYRGNILT